MEKVCIVMCTYNGGKYIREQINSILCQNSVDITLVIRDDGSTDNTREIIQEYTEDARVVFAEKLSEKHNELGVGNGFIKLIDYAVRRFEDIEYFGFSDQDDVWLPDKIIRGVSAISANAKQKVLYFTKKKVVDEKLQYLREDFVNYHDEFSDYLSQNDASGCTMLFNRAFAEFILQSPIMKRPYLHDVYFCKVALSTDTVLIYDNYESMLYRQHASNVEGARSVSVLSKKNIGKLFKKRRHFLYRITVDIYDTYKHNLKDEYKNYLAYLLKYKNPVYTVRLLALYYGSKHRSIKEKMRMTGMFLFHGV